jgi:hypothetical protein
MFTSAGRSYPWLVRLAAAWGIAAAVGTCLGGGVERRLVIRSNPPGALVYVDDYPIGTTPVAANFTYYGTRKIRLVKDGYETLTVMQTIPSPWYEVPPLDFISENFVPGEIRDQRTFTFQLTPQVVVPPEQLLSRAEGLRRGVGAPGGAVPPAGAPAVRVNPAAPRPPVVVPAPGAPEVLPTPPGVGGQPVYPLPPR